MATVTHVEPQALLVPDSITYPTAREIDDDQIQQWSQRDPGQIAYDEAYEIVDGQIQERPEMSQYSVELASILIQSLGPFVRDQDLGRAMIEGGFQTKPGQRRRPDLAFVSFDRWPKGRRAPQAAAWDLVPDLAVEVLSPNDEACQVLAKVREYFDAGVRAVWLVYPNVEVVHVYSSFTQIEVVTREQTLRGGAVVPGFELPLADLFEGEADLEAATTATPAPEPTA